MTARRCARDTPSPIVIDNYIVVVDMKGIACCYDRESGRELWKERICDTISQARRTDNPSALLSSL